MIRRLKTFFNLSASRKKMLVQTYCLSFYTFILFSFFKKQARFGQKATVPLPVQKPDPRAADIAYAIQTIARYVPWKDVCRHQAYQAMKLCNHYQLPCIVFVGFKKDVEKKEIQAHAWAVAGTQIIAGFCNPEEYKVQSIYKNKWE